jgi:hypothetical protein
VLLAGMRELTIVVKDKAGIWEHEVRFSFAGQ